MVPFSEYTSADGSSLADMRVEKIVVITGMGAYSYLVVVNRKLVADAMELQGF